MLNLIVLVSYYAKVSFCIFLNCFREYFLNKIYLRYKSFYSLLLLLTINYYLWVSSEHRNAYDSSGLWIVFIFFLSCSIIYCLSNQHTLSLIRTQMSLLLYFALGCSLGMDKVFWLNLSPLRLLWGEIFIFNLTE